MNINPELFQKSLLQLFGRDEKFLDKHLLP